MISASCTSDGMRVSSSIADELAAVHPGHDRAGHERGARRPFGEQPRVVPAVADRLLAGAGRALDEQRRVAADRGGEVLRQPALGRARHAEQQQRAVGRERRDGDLDEPAVADVLGRDRRSRRRACRRAGSRRPPTARAASRRAAAGRRGARAPRARRRWLLGVLAQDGAGLASVGLGGPFGGLGRVLTGGPPLAGMRVAGRGGRAANAAWIRSRSRSRSSAGKSVGRRCSP